MKKIIILSILFSFSILFFSCSNQTITADEYLTDEQILAYENRIQNGESVTLHSRYYFEMPSDRIRLKGEIQ
jgi:hypothetical protein